MALLPVCHSEESEHVVYVICARVSEYAFVSACMDVDMLVSLCVCICIIPSSYVSVRGMNLCLWLDL